MKPDFIYERCQTASRMEVMLLVAGGLGAITAALVVLAHGWLPAMAMLLLSVVAFALARLFDLASDLFKCLGRLEAKFDSDKPARSEPASCPPTA